MYFTKTFFLYPMLWYQSPVRGGRQLGQGWRSNKTLSLNSATSSEILNKACWQ